MRLIHDSLTKTQRAMCAYLNQKEKEGFRGHPVLFENNQRVERGPTTFHLSRHAWAETAFIKNLEFFYVIDDRCGKKKLVLNRGYGKWQKKMAEYFTMLIDFRIKHGIPIPEGKETENRQTLESRASVRYAGEETFERAAYLLNEVVGEFLRCLSSHAAGMSIPDNFDRVLACNRDVDGTAVLCNYLRHHTLRMLERKKIELKEIEITKKLEEFSELPKEKEIRGDILAAAVLWGVLYGEEYYEAERLRNNKKKGVTGELNRIKFTDRQTNAWHYVRRDLMNGIDEAIIRKALEIQKNTTCPPRVVWNHLKLHETYKLAGSFEVEGVGVRFEASPFAEKPIAGRENRLAIVIYPKDVELIAAMEKIADPTFEHSDGALAVARVSFHDNHVILEEIQSDAETLLRRSKKEQPKELKEFIAKWPKIAMESTRIFCRTHGFREFYAATPYRVLLRYGGPMHPDKTKIYFDGLEKMGGKLVYDDQRELDNMSQYYYVFEA